MQHSSVLSVSSPCRVDEPVSRRGTHHRDQIPHWRSSAVATAAKIISVPNEQLRNELGGLCNANELRTIDQNRDQSNVSERDRNGLISGRAFQ